MQYAVKHESCYDQNDHDNALDQQLLVTDQGFFIHRHDLGHSFRCCVQLLAINEVECGDGCCQHHKNDKTIIYQEVSKRKTCSTSDHDVRRVADQRARTADIRRQYLRHDIRNRIQIHFLRDRECHRSYQKNRGYIIQKSRQNRCDNDKEDHHLPRVALSDLCRFYCQVLKHPGMLYDCDKHHHADQQPDGVVVDIRYSGAYVQHP